jgi:hypothetical protein
LIPFANTPCRTVAEALAAGDVIATSTYGLTVAAILAACDAAHVAADQPPILPALDENRAAEMYARMKAFSEANPDASIEQAVSTAYNATREAMMLRPKMH